MTTMRVALVLRNIDERGGVGEYARRMTPALVALDRRNEYLLVFRSHEAAERHALAGAGTVVVEAPGKMLWDQVAVTRVLHREGIDVVLGMKHSVPLAARARKVFVLHGSDWISFRENYTFLDNRYHDLMLPRYLGAADRIIVVSHDSSRRIAEHMPSVRDRLRVVHYGVGAHLRPVTDADALAAARRAHGLPDRFVLFVGQIYRQKNLSGILRAMAQLRDRIPHQLVIAGRPSRKAAGELAWIDRLGMRDRVRIIGWVPNQELATLYSLAEAFVFPSRWEGFGIPIVEALACGCPVITSSAGSSPEVAGGAGLVVDPDSDDAIASVVTQPELADDLRRRGLERARPFTWERTARETLTVLQEAAVARPSPVEPFPDGPPDATRA